MKQLTTLFVCGLLLCLGCVDAPPYYYAEIVGGQTFVPINETIGAYPDDSVIGDSANPFAHATPGLETRWDIESYGDPVAAFYSWATLLVREPTGENQFYAALNLQRIYQVGRADEADLSAVRDLAIAGYTALLESFPESVTYDATGTIAFNLATPAYQGIVELGGVPRGWTLVVTEGEGRVAVKTHDVPPPLEAP